MNSSATKTRPGSRITGFPPTPDMRRQLIEIAAGQGAAIHDPAVAAAAATSPYLDHIRSTRRIIQDLIAARETELAKMSSAEQRQRVEGELSFLRDELARIDGQRCSGWRR